MAKRKAKSTPLGTKLIERFTKLRDDLTAVKSIAELPEKMTVRKVKLDLRPRSLTGKDVQEIRESFGLSQALFAQYLGVGTRTLQDWEQGVRSPTGAVLRVIEEMTDRPEYWAQRLREKTEVVDESKPRGRHTARA
jgi:putative transcriptional regulator